MASIMSVLVLLWAGTLTIIYACSYFELAEQNKGMLREHAWRYVLSRPGQARRRPLEIPVIPICLYFSSPHFIRLP